VEEAKAELAASHIKDKMQRAMQLEVPLVVDVGWGKSWAEAH
jgi:DNA polymerase I-like protein with 3'-5' exonuclease and polymerase domains